MPHALLAAVAVAALTRSLVAGITLDPPALIFLAAAALRIPAVAVALLATGVAIIGAVPILVLSHRLIGRSPARAVLLDRVGVAVLPSIAWLVHRYLLRCAALAVHPTCPHKHARTRDRNAGAQRIDTLTPRAVCA